MDPIFVKTPPVTEVFWLRPGLIDKPLSQPLIGIYFAAVDLVVLNNASTYTDLRSSHVFREGILRRQKSPPLAKRNASMT